MGFGMYLTFEHCRFEVVRVAEIDGGLQFAYKCTKCGMHTESFIRTEAMKQRPELLMYPDQRTMGVLTKHDQSHKPVPEPVVIDAQVMVLPDPPALPSGAMRPGDSIGAPDLGQFHRFLLKRLRVETLSPTPVYAYYCELCDKQACEAFERDGQQVIHIFSSAPPSEGVMGQLREHLKICRG